VVAVLRLDGEGDEELVHGAVSLKLDMAGSLTELPLADNVTRASSVSELGG
jgi:hypothetical protein